MCHNACLGGPTMGCFVITLTFGKHWQLPSGRIQAADRAFEGTAQERFSFSMLHHGGDLIEQRCCARPAERGAAWLHHCHIYCWR
jgi:hypothetical protein